MKYDVQAFKPYADQFKGDLKLIKKIAAHIRTRQLFTFANCSRLTLFTA